MNKKNLPAFPVECAYPTNGNDPYGVQTASNTGWEKGLSKRELIAAHVLNGLIAQCAPGSWQPREMQHLAQQAAAFADTLLAELARAENDLP